MNEQELYAKMSVIADPINNVYKLNSRADIEEIRRMLLAETQSYIDKRLNERKLR